MNSGDQDAVLAGIAADLDEIEELLPRLAERLSDRPSAPPDGGGRRSLAEMFEAAADGVAQFASGATAYRSPR